MRLPSGCLTAFQSAEPWVFPKAALLDGQEEGSDQSLLPIRGLKISNLAMETLRLPKESLSPALKSLHPLLGACFNVSAAEQ